MTKQSLIHVKADYGELINSKKEFLSAEMTLIKILQIIKKYNALRKKEFMLKLKILKKLKETKTGIKKLEQELPKPEIPKILENKKEVSRANKLPKKTDKLERQLEEIQEKLKELEG